MNENKVFSCLQTVIFLNSILSLENHISYSDPKNIFKNLEIANLVWDFQDLCITEILREINFVDYMYIEVQKLPFLSF